MTVLSEHVRVLLREARAEPDDDTPRLVLADWLQDQGDPRGELIAVQMERHRLLPDDTRQVELARRERQLLGRHLFDWLGPLVDLVSEWRFERGLIHLTARADRLVEPDLAGPTVAAVLPWVERLRLTDLQVGHFVRLFGSPLLLRHLVRLDLAGNRLSDSAVDMLTGWPHLGYVRQLDLRDNGIRRAAAIRLAQRRHLSWLRWLDLRGNPVDPAGRAALVARFGDRVILDG